MYSPLKNTLLIFFITLIFMFSHISRGHEDATGIVKERMDLMDSLKSAMKELKPFFREGKAYDTEMVKETALQIRDSAGVHMSNLFPENSMQKPSEALPEIWQEWPEFKKLSGELEVLAQALYDANNGNSVADIDDAKAKALSADLFKKIAKNCSACHKQFRER